MSLDLSFGRLDFVIPSSAKLGKYRVAGMGRWGWNGWQPPPPAFGVPPPGQEAKEDVDCRLTVEFLPINSWLAGFPPARE